MFLIIYSGKLCVQRRAFFTIVDLFSRVEFRTRFHKSSYRCASNVKIAQLFETLFEVIVTVFCIQNCCYLVTSRQRHKSATYLRLKNSKNTSKSQDLQYSKTQMLDRIGALKGNPLGFFNFSTFLWQNIKKLKGDPLESLKIFPDKVSQCRKNWKGGPPLWDFSTSILSQNIKKIERELWGLNFFPKKCLTKPKN